MLAKQLAVVVQGHYEFLYRSYGDDGQRENDRRQTFVPGA
jgi:hypothetical protein